MMYLGGIVFPTLYIIYLHNVRPSKYQLEGFARAILPAILRDFQDPEFKKEYEKWRAEHQATTNKHRKGRRKTGK